MTLRLSAHLNTLYPSVPFRQRFGAAAADGFAGVEMWEAPPRPDWREIVAELKGHGLTLCSVNTRPGGGEAFGCLGDPDRVTWWRQDFLETLEFAREADALHINVLAGGRVSGHPFQRQMDCLVDNLDWALSIRGSTGPTLLLEPLNAVDRRSPLLRHTQDAVAVLERLGRPRGIGILFDAYHVGQEEDDVLESFAACAEDVKHVQVADFPGRGQPGSWGPPHCEPHG